eukprot:scaffold112920_cov19-Tisochrysis_lutea.AAC.1
MHLKACSNRLSVEAEGFSLRFSLTSKLAGTLLWHSAASNMAGTLLWHSVASNMAGTLQWHSAASNMRTLAPPPTTTEDEMAMPKMNGADAMVLAMAKVLMLQEAIVCQKRSEEYPGPCTGLQHYIQVAIVCQERSGGTNSNFTAGSN